ncbi:Fanconi anemia core complex-associated protein 100 isoform X2 [Hippocampus zosterae]|uniref:Fanconi anemia core complex-associated protein 100 isoform X2 n=1 Tax=Hippocampus zosterae TaxID=109293 RepID=UPI00223E6516|nr:Fanconi anemia core complex-associated protein 100 isoform X2 [Hippocampus zosterae]
MRLFNHPVLLIIHLQAVLIFPGPVRDLVVDEDEQILYAACCSGVYCIRFSSLSSRIQRANSSTAPCVKVSSKDLVIREDGVFALLLVNSVLLSLRLTNASWLLSRYKIAEASQLTSYETCGSFKVPLISDSEDHSPDELSERRPVLFCVHSADSPSSSSLPSGHIRLEPLLFKLLFGIDAALAKSPVVICGLPDGRLCFAAHRVPGSQLRVLHSLEQPVVFVGASAGTRTDPADRLVALGERGRVVLVASRRGGPQGGGVRATFTELSVPGPVVCAFLHERLLYYSTGSDLLVLHLASAEAANDEAGSPNKVSPPWNVISLNVCRLIALARPARTTEGKVELLGLSCRGQLQRISFPVGLHDGGPSQLPSSRAGRSIKDVLSAIGNVSERASVLKASIKSRNQTLKRLNQVLNIIFLLSAGADGGTLSPAREKPIRCHAAIGWMTLLQKDSLNLNCILDNASSYILEQGWTLNVSASSLCDSTKGQSRSAHYSFPFQNLQPGEKLEISLPLATEEESSLPCLVSFSLTLSLGWILGAEEAASQPDGGLVSLPLNTLLVDYLHALRMVGPAGRNATPQRYDVTAGDGVQAFLERRRGGGSHAGSARHSTSVKVSSQLVRDTLKNSERRPGETLPSVCVALLDWLLREGHGGVKMEGDKMAIKNSVVHARAPNGGAVKLTAKEIKLAVEHEESLAIVEVQVESSSLEAVCGTHHAILRRVQNLLQKAPEKPSATIRMQSLRAREALLRAEEMLQRLHQSRVSCTFGEGVSTGKTLPSP